MTTPSQALLDLAAALGREAAREDFAAWRKAAMPAPAAPAPVDKPARSADR